MIEKCTKIKELTIPSSVDTFYTGAVGYGCLCGSSVKKVIFEDGTRNIPGYICRDSSELETIVLPESVESIGESSFRNCPRIKTISLPENVESIGNSCFSDCTALESFTFNKNVKNLGHDLFNGCKKLKELTIPASVENVDSKFDLYGCLAGCGVETVIFEEGIRSIPHCICAGATQLKTVIIPEAPSKTLEGFSIGSSAFEGTAIESIELPASLTNIGASAFEGCSLLKSISLPDGLKTLEKECFKDCVLLTELEIPSSVTTLGEEMISGCNKIKYLDIPAGVTNVSGETGIVGGNRVDTGVIVGSGVEYLNFENGMKKVPDYIAKDSKELKTVILPDTVTEIGNHAFENCTALKKVESSNSSLKFSSDTFMGCESLNDKRLTVFEPNNTYFIANTERGSVNGIINYKLKYDLLPSVISDAQSMKLNIEVPDGLTLMLDTIRSKDLSINTEDIQNGVIPVNSRSGEMEFSVRVTDIGNYKISASLLFESDKTKWNQPIGTLYVDCPDITISAPAIVNSYEAEVYGVSQRDHDVEIFVNNKSAGVFRTNKYTGKYHGTISLPESPDGSVYTIYAKCGSLKSEEMKVEYSAGKPSVKKVILKYGVHGNKFEKLDITDVFTKGTSPVVVFQSDLGFDITTVNTDKIDRLFVTSQKGDDIKYIEAYYNAEKDLWSTEGNFDENDPHYVPGTLNIFILEKKDYIAEYSSEDAMKFTDLPDDIMNNSKVEVIDCNEDKSQYIADIKISDGEEEHSFAYYADDNASGGFIDNTYYTIDEITENLDEFTAGKEAFTTIEDNKEVKYYVFYSELSLTQNTNVKKAPAPLTPKVKNGKQGKTLEELVNDASNWVGEEYKIEKGKDNIYKLLQGSSQFLADGFSGSLILKVTEDSLFGSKTSENKYVKLVNRFASNSVMEAYKYIADKTSLSLFAKGLNTGAAYAQYKYYKNTTNNGKIKTAAGILFGMKAFNTWLMPVIFASNPVLGAVLGWGLGMLSDSLNDYIQYCMDNGFDPSVDGFFRYITPGWLKWIWDPSGTVYDAASGEPLKDATVTLYYLDPETGQSVKWNAEDYDQMNPLTTDSDGSYLWDVPEGKWKVVCHKEGYEDAESEWLDVPPIRTDVNITMTANGETISTTTATATTTVTTTSTQTSTTTTQTSTTTTTSKTTTTTNKSTTTTTLALKTSTNTSTTTTAPITTSATTSTKPVTSTTTSATTTSKPITTSTTTTAPDQSQPKYQLGDVNDDGQINAVDASSVLSYYAMISTNKDGGYTEEQKLAADVNNDGQINAVDASCILSYYAYVSTTKEDIMSISEFMKK